MPNLPCPCNPANTFDQCCGLYLSGKAYPNKAETLMRSRYSAYVMGNLAYLRKSWHPDTCPELSVDDLHNNWAGLEVIKSKQGLKRSIVEFKAWYSEDGVKQAIHEISLFKLYKKRWVYFSALDNWP